MNTQKYLTTPEQLGLMHKHQQFPDQKTLEKKMNSQCVVYCKAFYKSIHSKTQVKAVSKRV